MATKMAPDAGMFQRHILGWRIVDLKIRNIEPLGHPNPTMSSDEGIQL